MKRVIEFESQKALQFETEESLQILDEKFQAIEENFYKMEFFVQQFDISKHLSGEYLYKLPTSILKQAVVDLDNASDEFYLELTEPVTQQEFEHEDGLIEVVKHSCIIVEVVTEGVAEDNDSEFIGKSKYQALIEAEDYKVGGTNSYYKVLGDVGNMRFYYREL